MKKLLLLFVLLSLNVTAQNTSQPGLLSKIKSDIEYDKMEDALIQIIVYTNLYGENEEIRFLKAASIYYSLLRDIEYKDYNSLLAVSEYFHNELNHFKGNKGYQEKLMDMSITIDFAFIYYIKYKSQLKPEEYKARKENLLATAYALKGDELQADPTIRKIIDFIERER